jgi:hypothetical protein
MLQEKYHRLLAIVNRFMRLVAYFVISIAVVAYIYISYPKPSSTDITLTELTVRGMVDIVGFFLVILCGIILAGGIIRAGVTNDSPDRGYLLVLLALVFLFRRSGEYLTLGGDAWRGTEGIVAWLKMVFVGRLIIF